jgi:hypothetical protein
MYGTCWHMLLVQVVKEDKPSTHQNVNVLKWFL